MVNNFELENWLPMEPAMGPPLPRFLNILWPWYKPPEEKVAVALRNPPSEATTWSLTLLDWDITTPIYFVGRNGKDRLDITEAATFEIPSGLKFPLRILALSISKWIDFYGTPALKHLYEMQSFRPYLWDWDKGDWGDIPDPNYREVFIPEYGSFYYNVATEQFERA